MDLQGLIERARDTITVKQVYGKPFQQNGVTVIPAAKVGGGGGGGEGSAPEGKGEGSGGGFGMVARPTGAFVIRGDQVSWQPAVDVNRAILTAGLMAVTALFTLRAVTRARAKARAKAAKAEARVRTRGE
ncbi:MAG: spore germination protein GerW family protein [Actinomycetota bacterium]